MWESDSYCWIVICKNKRFHSAKDPLYGHKIPLGPTDTYASPPTLDGGFRVRCDECGEEYMYKADDVMRFEMEMPESLAPHPLFQ